MEGDIFSKRNNFEKWKDVHSNLLLGDYNACPNPLVSIVIPCYKRPDTLKLALESAINQDCNFEYEIVVVDNNCEGDKSPNQEVVEQCGAKNVFYYRNAQNIGMIGNWNRGVELSRAQNITYCHDDDILLSNCLSRLMEIRKKYPRVCILSAWNIIDDNGNYTYQKEGLHRKSRLKFMLEKEYYKYSLYDQFLQSRGFGCGCLFVRDIMLEIGGYDPAFYPSCDYALHSKYTYYYGCIYTTIPTFNYRIGTLNESNTAAIDFNNADMHFRNCMMRKIALPRKFLQRLSHALYRVRAIQFERLFKIKNEVSQLPSKADYRIIKIASYYAQSIKPYKIDFMGLLCKNS